MIKISKDVTYEEIGDAIAIVIKKRIPPKYGNISISGSINWGAAVVIDTDGANGDITKTEGHFFDRRLKKSKVEVFDYPDGSKILEIIVRVPHKMSAGTTVAMGISGLLGPVGPLIVWGIDYAESDDGGDEIELIEEDIADILNSEEKPFVYGNFKEAEENEEPPANDVDNKPPSGDDEPSLDEEEPWRSIRLLFEEKKEEPPANDRENEEPPVNDNGDDKNDNDRKEKIAIRILIALVASTIVFTIIYLSYNDYEYYRATQQQDSIDAAQRKKQMDSIIAVRRDKRRALLNRNTDSLPLYSTPGEEFLLLIKSGNRDTFAVSNIPKKRKYDGIYLEVCKFQDTSSAITFNDAKLPFKHKDTIQISKFNKNIRGNKCSLQLPKIKDGDYIFKLYVRKDGQYYMVGQRIMELDVKVKDGKYHFVTSPVYLQNRTIFYGEEIIATDDNELFYGKLKTQIYYGWDYKEIDPSDYLMKDTKGASEILKLATKITAKCTNDYDRAKAINNWVASHIYYDYDLADSIHKGGSSDFLREYTLSDKTDILHKKRAVCEGIAKLTQELLVSIGIPCRELTGRMIEQGNWYSSIVGHSWVAAYIDGRWVIMDVTNDCTGGYKDGVYNDSYSEMLFSRFDLSIDFISTYLKMN
ncbi:MAG: transglutaminase-like domain-containing protein [Ignavibacteria bacterium]|jgi:hypothetical protein|nr:transglutaminase-like domain-containing protein [Ignavibacteria bacterium]